MSKNKRQNRRCEPKVSQMDKQGWKSLFIVLGEIVLTCVLACGIPYGVYLFYQHQVAAGHFVPHQITVHGNVRVDDASILEASGLQVEDANLFEIDVHTIESGIETLSWVKKAKVRIDLPDKVDIEITEHHPLGLVNDGQLYVVDEFGAAIKHWTPDDMVMAPVVTLDKMLDVRGKAVVQAFELAESVKKSGYSHRLEEIHYDDATGFTLYTETTEIRLGYDRFDERLDRLMIVEEILNKREVEAAYILLDGDTSLDRIVVRPVVHAPMDAATSETAAETAENTAVEPAKEKEASKGKEPAKGKEASKEKAESPKTGKSDGKKPAESAKKTKKQEDASPKEDALSEPPQTL